MSLYDGTGNDINIAGFKTTNIALKNTPQQNPKEFKTKTEKQAKENDGKTSSIINLLDEIDTTLYVINDKLDETRNYVRKREIKRRSINKRKS